MTRDITLGVRLTAVFERHAGSDEAGLREGFYARVEERTALLQPD